MLREAAKWSTILVQHDVGQKKLLWLFHCDEAFQHNTE